MKNIDRCDRCSAQAYVMTLHSGYALMWCNHCFTKHENLLIEHIYIDERVRLATTV